MLRSKLRIGTGIDVENRRGMSGKDFGPNWVSGLFFFLSLVLFKKPDQIQVSYFFEYIHWE